MRRKKSQKNRGFIDSLLSSTILLSRLKVDFVEVLKNALIALIISIGVFAAIASFLQNASGLSSEQMARIGEINMRRIVIFYGAFAFIAVIYSYWKNKYLFISIILFIYWLLGVGLVFVVSSNNSNTQPQQTASEEIVSDRSSCNEEDTLNQAKNCTTLILRDDGGHGSGFSIKEGFLVTNRHIIEDTDGLSAWVYDKWEDVKVWNYSPTFDIAILKLQTSIPTCKWFVSSNLKLAETLYAIGWPNNPSGESTITKGIFSRLNQYNDGLEFVQTDAAINPGSSGGPLINTCGVVGINTQKELWTDEQLPRPLEGLGNALSSKILIPLIDQLINEGSETAIIPKSEKRILAQPNAPSIPSNSPTLDVNEIKQHLYSVQAAKTSWERAKQELPRELYSKLLDSLTRQILFCETLIQRLESGKRTNQDDLIMWDAIVKMSWESAEIARVLNRY